MTDIWKSRSNVWNTVFDKLFGKKILNNDNLATNINLETPLLISNNLNSKTDQNNHINNDDTNKNDKEVDKVIHDYLLFNFILY